jgi:hypothetical protein
MISIWEWHVVFLEAYPEKSKDELLAKEAHYIRIMQRVIKNIPMETKKMYRNDNKKRGSETKKSMVVCLS